MSESDHFPELAEKLQAIRDRIRLRVERTPLSLPEFRVPALEKLEECTKTPLSNAEGLTDVSLGSQDQQLFRSLATAIGGVNPRLPGLGNEFLQSLKRTLSRISDWQLRPQREFNLAVVESQAQTTAALQSVERHFLGIEQALQHLAGLMRQSIEQRDQRQQEFLGELDALCEQITLQRWSYEGALMRHTNALEDLRSELGVWGQELQSVRQRVAAQAKAQAARPEGIAATSAEGTSPAASLPVDYFQLERHFRGTEEEIRKRQRFYQPFFRERRQVLDIACGRGEFLELMREAGASARGVDLDADMVGRCLEKGLDAVQADVFAYLENVADASLDGIFSSQFVEHLEPQTYLRLITECVAKLAPGGVLALETQNPECLAIFSQSFYLDPTHVRPIPPAQLRFALIEAGLERVTTHLLSPASAILPLVPQLPNGAMEPAALRAYNTAVNKFNETFFGGMDYAVIGYRPAKSA
jgi:2-polyprenyl-3-methyl-5-hydroxy-6-metoxy-1,4-benzoquinol methylase